MRQGSDRICAPTGRRGAPGVGRARRRLEAEAEPGAVTTWSGRGAVAGFAQRSACGRRRPWCDRQLEPHCRTLLAKERRRR